MSLFPNTSGGKAWLLGDVAGSAMALLLLLLLAADAAWDDSKSSQNANNAPCVPPAIREAGLVLLNSAKQCRNGAVAWPSATVSYVQHACG
jgi:hypothetical protein